MAEAKTKEQRDAEYEATRATMRAREEAELAALLPSQSKEVPPAPATSAPTVPDAKS